MNGIFFDLDLTLIDSLKAEPFRKARDWQHVYAMIPELKPYPGVTELLRELTLNTYSICIITSAPESYCRRIITYWKWPVKATVCYHDTQHRKPYPDPFWKGLEKLQIKPDKAISVGDHQNDILASHAAKVRAIGALWGTQDREALLGAEPEFSCDAVADLRRLLLGERVV